ncbi:DUF4276 family protein [Vitreoscilla filiformis]|nr:DUF4276 family protein [Vitreoscilla filiformis]
MRYLNLALYSEGRTDDRFLSGLLLRLTQDVCAGDVEMAEQVLALADPGSPSSGTRHDRILQAATAARGAWQILFVHADADADANRARSERVDPALALLKQRFGLKGLGVGVVPVRNCEAWALADGDALRRVFGTRLDNQALGLPATPKQVESISDPKQVLEAAFKATRPSGRHARAGVASRLTQLGEEVSLDLLRQVSAFSALDSELRQALASMHILR